MNCKFLSKYFDYEKGDICSYQCMEKEFENNHCIFHNASSQPSDIEKKFSDYAKSAQENNEPLICIGFQLPNAKLFGNFSKPVYFTRTRFRSADFSKAIFKQVDFGGSIFNGDANFIKSEFHNADFLGAEFYGSANFVKSKFEGKVNFSGAKFQNVDFSESLLQRASFIGTKSQIANFSLAKIQDSDFFGFEVVKNANFVGVEIVRSNFPRAKFRGNSNFTGAVLEKVNFPLGIFNQIDFTGGNFTVVELDGCRILGNSDFSQVKFENVNFNKVEFLGNTVFSESILKRVGFQNSTFNDVGFVKAKLNKINFSGTKFDGKSNFRMAVFNDETDFVKTRFQEVDFTETRFKGRTRFNMVLFSKQNETFFDVEDLSLVSFIGTDITGIQFGQKVKWGGKDGYEVIDDQNIEQLSKDSILELIAFYRNLKTNYELRLRNEDALIFMRRENELKRFLDGINEWKVEGSDLLLMKLEEITRTLTDLTKRITAIENQSIKEQNKN